MMCSATSLAYTPGASLPSTFTRRTFGLRIAIVCVASTSRTWLVPMPNAIAPNAPCVEVCESPHAIVMPGLGDSLLRPDDVDDALLARRQIEKCHVRLRAILAQRLDHVIRERIRKRLLASSVGTM